MKRAARTDSNQAAIVSELRQRGCSVFVTSAVGRGFPDICVGFRRRTYLFEVKQNDRKKLTSDQETFHAIWAGQIARISSAAEAWAIIERS